ncbi:MAG: hypothetical protein U0T81_17415 [Saprospiraceae bacterium]
MKKPIIVGNSLSTLKQPLSEVDFSNVPFGKVFADHMFVADFDGKQWTNLEICPLHRIPLHPAAMAWHEYQGDL